MLRILYFLLILAALCLGASLAFYNYENVSLNYLAGEIQLPMIGVIIGFLFIGVLVGLLIAGTRIIGLRAELAASRRRLNNAQTELKNLRSLPIKDAAAD